MKAFNTCYICKQRKDMKQPLYAFNKETFDYDFYKYNNSNMIYVILMFVFLLIGLLLGYFIGTNKTKQNDTIKVIHSDSLSVYYPIDITNSIVDIIATSNKFNHIVNVGSIKGNTKVANDLRYYYNQIIKRK